jgi:hypothetical protein
MDLSPAGGDADLLRSAHGSQIGFGRVQFGVCEPYGLRQKDEEQGSGEKLGAAEAFAGEKSGH